jgi:hypothetical protein
MIKHIEKFRETLDYLERHYNNVQKAWVLVQDTCSDFDFIQNVEVRNEIDAAVKVHDLSKLSAEEFTQYRQWFHPVSKEIRDKPLVRKAFNHHIEHNEHHWQTWTTKYDRPEADIHLVHNIIDWIATGFEFEDNAKVYYENNKHNIILPEWAITLMYSIFDRVYTTESH